MWYGVEHIFDTGTLPGLQPSVALDLMYSMRQVVITQRLVRREKRPPLASSISGESARCPGARRTSGRDPVIFAKRVFLIAAIYGFIVLLPQYFLEEQTGRDFPPAITHPEYFYGFIGIAVAWQMVFLIISRDPIRYRPLMLVAVVEKIAFGVPAIALYFSGRLSRQMLGAGILDLILGVLFILSYRRTATSAQTASK